MTRMPSAVRQLQEWFAGAIMHPGPVADGARLAPHAERFFVDGVARALTPGPLASAMDRLAIYQDAYQSRLVECLGDDYPALRYALHEEGFGALCRAYIAEHPSRSPSLNAFGRHMADFAHAHGGEHGAFASALARLEWAMVEAIHAPEAEIMPLDALATIAPERWPAARLPASSAVRILKFDYPVNRFFQAFRNDETPSLPEAEASATAVYRKNHVVWRMDLTPAMAHVLDALFAGATLEEALSSIAPLEEPDVASWFREWVAAGFFARAELG